ncbi:neoverrucotoxin subunit alpha-like [Stegastes partitus]|uniref:Neoverrucotoxin subunit alpha-like n=1 Tax=Stegastes partitus TaxID=144197 RepID=A0A9Y4KMU9_9TELE|nr:PREDICTED: neoverrucotoxin subunit alpha-like [Stegastes partitus]
MASRQLHVAALGRPFSLGMLYDARRDKLYSGFSLWDKETLQKSTNAISQHSSTFEVTESDSTDSKSSLLSVEASLKASYMGGLVEVGGSAKYLDDKKKFKNQSRVTLQYKATTNSKQFLVTHEEAKDKQAVIPPTISATHVVTGILYGANAFFVFDSEKLEASSIQDVQAGMHAVINKIPKLNVEAKVDTQFTHEENTQIQKFSCKFYGDFILESNPATFEDAVKAYVQLPTILGEGVPLKATLMPLKSFDFAAEELKAEICIGLLRKAHDTLEEMNEAEMRCSDSLDEKVVENFPQLHKTLSKFQDLCSDYRAVLRRNMEKKFPAIRAGKEKEASVEKLFDDRKKSPFSQNNLSKWLEEKEKEINIIRACKQIIEAAGVKVVSNRSNFDREVRTPGADEVLCFIFTSLESDDPHLEQMADYLHSCEDESTTTFTPPTQERWYSSQDVFANMRKKARAFRDLAKALKSCSKFHFFVAAVPDSKYKGATIYHYRDGILITDDFSKFNIPDVTTVRDRRDLIWYACDLTLDPNTVGGYLTLSDGNNKATCGPWQNYSDQPERFGTRPQVLCRELLTGRHYWEVEWSKFTESDVGVAVTYKGIERKGDYESSGLGCNSISWFFGERYAHNAWHDGEVWRGPYPPPESSRIGVYLDWGAGTLSFYGVTSNTLNHLYTFRTKFTEPVYVGFWARQYRNYVALCPI